MLRVENLRKAFQHEGADVPVVDVPAFSLGAGEQIGLRGSSGSGKTTFLHLIAGLHRADAGSICIENVDMVSLPEAGRDRHRARCLGYIFQSFNLLQGYTALENVLLGMAFSGRAVDVGHAKALLERMGLSHRFDYLPGRLSTGQQQRVAVARALANRPKLVLADEPTGNLDSDHAGEAVNLIRAVCRENGASLLLVSHDDGVLSQFETVIPFSEINRAAVKTGGLP